MQLGSFYQGRLWGLQSPYSSRAGPDEERPAPSSSLTGLVEHSRSAECPRDGSAFVALAQKHSGALMTEEALYSELPQSSPDSGTAPIPLSFHCGPRTVLKCLRPPWDWAAARQS